MSYKAPASELNLQLQFPVFQEKLFMEEPINRIRLFDFLKTFYFISLTHPAIYLHKRRMYGKKRHVRNRQAKGEKH